MTEQLTLFTADHDHIDHDHEPLFEPNGQLRCEHCRQPLTPFGGRLYCLRVGCTGATR